jgi:prolyl oligopeptidase
MRHLLLLATTLACAACAPTPPETAPIAPAKQSLVYPAARTVDQTDDYQGTSVSDPYRWLEELDAPDTRAWIEAENALTQQYLGEVKQRPHIHARMTELWNYERFGLPSHEGDRYFITRNDGLQNQAVLYTMSSLDAEPVALLDPNTFSSDGTVALSGNRASPDGKLLAYGTSSGGSDWQEWRVRDIATGKDTDDVVQWVKFSGADWAKDSSGFYYGRYDEPQDQNKLKAVNEFQKIYFHKIGTPQSQDVLVYDRPDQPKWGFQAEVSEDGHYLIITVSQGTDERNRLFYRDLSAADSKVVELISELEASYLFIGNEGPVFWFQTNLDAPRNRIIAIDTRQPDKANWQTLVTESDATLVSTNLVNHQFIGQYLRDARSEVKRYALDGTVIDTIELPGIGAAAGFNGKSSDTETFYSYTSFTVPTDIYRLDLSSGQSSLLRRPQVAFDPALYETRQVRYTSKDGTQVPMFITARKGLVLDGQQPTLLYGYGGFNIPVTPNFTVPMATWLDLGGVYAVANLRGGGEYGDDWHQAGTKLHKQNVFDDFIGAAEYLIAEHYTSPDKLAIYGRSNGGLLAAATLLQRPDLFRAALPGVGVLDMLRFNKFTIGWAWESDYGSPQNAEEFKALRAYSPLHNIKPGTRYPATLITTGDHDDRVFPAHSFKFTAALQAAGAGPGPYLARIETRAGHGAGKPTSMQIDEWTDMLSFLVRELGMDRP